MLHGNMVDDGMDEKKVTKKVTGNGLDVKNRIYKINKF